MTLDSMAAQYARRHKPHTATAWPDYIPPCLSGEVAISGLAPIASPPPKRDGETRTLIQLELLLAEAKRARNLRQSKRASLIEADLRALRRGILAGGNDTCS